MTPTTPRAPRMGRDDRRRMLVARTTELLADTGRPVNTREIARAAGIGEGTVFRAFADKDELLNECLFEAMRMEQATEQVRALPVEGELGGRLVAAAEIMQGHIARAGAVAAALGRRLPTAPEGEGDAAFTAARDALAALMEPERARLSHPPETVAVLLIGLLFERTVGPAAVLQLPVYDLVSVVLHGALTPDERNDR